MTYILEAKVESDRLDRQSKLIQYSIADELKDLKIHDNNRILDAGCGAGSVSKYLLNNFKNINITAVDFSEQRVQQSRSLFSEEDLCHLDFQVQDLRSTSLKTNSFDIIITRYVLQHINELETVMREFSRILKPGGSLYVIDASSIIFDLYSMDEELNLMLNKIKNEINCDLFVGKKIAPMMQHLNFTNINWDLEPMIFKNQDLDDEIALNKERMNIIKPDLMKILGGEKNYKKFESKFFKEMGNPANSYYYEKFIVRGKKSLSMKLI